MMDSESSIIDVEDTKCKKMSTCNAEKTYLNCLFNIQREVTPVITLRSEAAKQIEYNYSMFKGKQSSMIN